MKFNNTDSNSQRLNVHNSFLRHTSDITVSDDYKPNWVMSFSFYPQNSLTRFNFKFGHYGYISNHLPNVLATTPTLKEPTIPPTLKMATAKLHTMVHTPGLMGSP